MPEPEEHREAMMAAIEAEACAQRALLAGDADAATRWYREAIPHWRHSWETAPPRSFGRLIGMLKAAILAGELGEEARMVIDSIDEPDSPPAAYALALASLAVDDDEEAHRHAGAMRGGSDAFVRTADAIDALARRDADAYAAALQAIVEDFEQRPEHLTGVAFADTALMLDRLAEPRGLAVRPASPVLPPG